MSTENSNSAIEHELLSAKRVAELLDISVRGVWRHVSEGNLPQPLRVGRLARWKAATIHNWIDEGCPKRRAR